MRMLCHGYLQIGSRHSPASTASLCVWARAPPPACLWAPKGAACEWMEAFLPLFALALFAAMCLVGCVRVFACAGVV